MRAPFRVCAHLRRRFGVRVDQQAGHSREPGLARRRQAIASGKQLESRCRLERRRAAAATRPTSRIEAMRSSRPDGSDAIVDDVDVIDGNLTHRLNRRVPISCST